MAIPLINGINYSWANIAVGISSVPLIGVAKITYKSKQNKENNYGFGTEPISRGYGNVEYEGSIDIYTDDWKRIIAASPNRRPTQLAPFDINVVFAGIGVLPTKDVLRACEFLEDGLDAGQGDTKLIVSIPLIIGAIER